MTAPGVAGAREPDTHVEEPGPAELNNDSVRSEFQRAGVWFGIAIAIALVVLLAQPILLILGALVLTAMLDGGARLLGRILPIGRGWRLAIAILLVFGFIVWTFYFAGSELAGQAQAFRVVIETQLGRLVGWARQMGISVEATDLKGMANQVLGSLGRVTAFVTGAVGTITSLIMMLVLAIFISIEPRLYERGLAWMLPMESRPHFYEVTSKMAYTLRRLMAGRLVGMAVEGLGTWLLLMAGGIPLAALLGLLTGLLTFLPNIGSIISGVFVVLVGFSTGMEGGLYAIGVYLAVQMFDGYLVVPMVAKRAVDLAPAVVLAGQIIFGALFGILGLALADPIIAMAKVYLEERAKLKAKEKPQRPAPPRPRMPRRRKA